MDTRRHAPIARRRSPHAHTGRAATSAGGRFGARGGDIFSDDGLQPVASGGLRWLVSTTLAGGIGALSVAAVVFGSTGPNDTEPPLQRVLKAPQTQQIAALRPGPVSEPGLRWAIPKTDRLQTMTAALSARFLIHDTMRIRRANRDAIVKQAYVRLIARLGPISASEAEKIPPFNPYRLYASTAGDDDAGAHAAAEDSQDLTTRVIEAFGGLLPVEDGQEIDAQDAGELVLRAIVAQEDATANVSQLKGGFRPEGLAANSPGQLLADRSQRAGLDRLPPNTSALAKTVIENDDALDDLESRQVRVVKVSRGQTMTRILLDLGGDRVHVRSLVEAARTVLPDNALVAGQEVHVTLVPSLTRPGALDPARVSVFGDEHEHKLTVARNAAGEFTASATPLDDRVGRATSSGDDQAPTASLYASFFNAALGHGLPADTIMQLLRIHAYETDFRRRVRGSDHVEWFFDTKEDDRGLEAALGDLLMTSITTGGETQRFYRFRTSDGTVDFFDESGNTSRKFLMRQPVRGAGMRLASGFGLRMHPLLGFRRPHNGVDWAGPVGTPIMAAGSGVIEEAGRKGEYGNYVRIRHANGYKTSYAHMMRFAPGVSDGVRVNQGQVIGYLGNTGLSAGPHLHYEVLINNQPVDPMSIQVPRDKQLANNELRAFLKEKSRIDELLRRNPVSSRIVDQQAALRQ